MPTSVRLDRQTEELLNKAAKALRLTKTEVIKSSIHHYCEMTIYNKSRRPYDLISDLIGTEKSGNGNLAINSEKILREKFGRKR